MTFTSVGAVGSTLFSYLFLRARSIPAALAWLGVIGSVLLVIALPLRILTGMGGTVAFLPWIPMAAFEVSLALWLILKGVCSAPPPRVTNRGLTKFDPALEFITRV